MTATIDQDTILSNRYLITKFELETATGDWIYQAIDQILGRQVSIFVPEPSAQDEVIAVAKDHARYSSENYVNVLDISTLNSSRIFIVTTTTTIPQMLRYFNRPTTPKQPLADIISPTRQASRRPSSHSENGAAASAHTASQETLTENINLLPPETEGSSTPQNNHGRLETPTQQYALAEEEGFTAEPNIPVASAGAQDFLIPFHTESHPIINLENTGNNEEEEEEETPDDAYHEERAKSSSLSWLLGTGLVIATLFLAFIGIYLLNEALQTSSTDANVAEASDNASASGPEQESSHNEKNDEPIKIVDVTRYVDGFQDTEAGNTSSPANIISPDAGAWITLQYSNDTFGGFFSSLSLSLELQEESDIHEVTIDQQGTTGGMFTVYASDTPAPTDNAEEIAQGSFTGPNIKLPISKEVNAKYVIVTFTQLPRLQNPGGSYPYGIRLTHIELS